MPLPLAAAILPPLIAGLSSGINAGLQTANNKKQERFSREMYEKQRQDNLAQWHMQNDYNSPTSQMARLRQAGLNPNLIYGHGSNASNAAAMPSVSPPSYNPKAPEFDANSISAAYFDTRIKDAQYDNLKAQNTVLVQDAALKAATTASNLAKTAKTEFDLSQADRLKDISAETAAEGLRGKQLSNQYILSENDRRNIHTDLNVQQNVERILTSKLGREKTQIEMEKLRKEVNLQQLDTNLRQNGITPSDPVYLRILSQLLSNLFQGSVLDPSFIK